MTETDPGRSASVAKEVAPVEAQAPRTSPWIWVGLGLALLAKLLSLYRPQTPVSWIFRLFLLPFGILTYWAYTRDTGRSSVLRGPRAVLFAILVLQSFYWGVNLGGLAAAVGAIVVYTRFIRPHKASSTPSPGGREQG